MPGNVDNIHIPGPEENALINADTAEDPDTFELDEQRFADARPSSEVIPHILENLRRTRGKQKAPTKKQLHIRLDADIIDWFKNTSPDERGYQTRINQALRDHIDRHSNRPTQ